jgi:uncharacterized delta-60 repeat protein
MAKVLQFRRGTTAELASITGAVGELFVDTTKDTVVVHDGSTQGGFPLQRELVSGTSIKTVNGTSLLGSGNVDLSTNLTLVGNQLRYTNIDGTLQTIDLSPYLDDTTNTISSGTLSGNTITFTREDSTTFTVDVSALYDDTNLVTSVNGSTGAVTVQDTLVSGTNIKTINGTSLLGSGDITISGGSGDATWGSITGTLSSQTDLQNALNAKQATLVSGTNIKTINGTSLLGSGDIVISGGDGGGATTYTTGNQYTEQGLAWNTFSDPNIIVVIPDEWTDTNALNLLLSQPSGTVYNVDLSIFGEPATGTLTTTSAWTDEGGFFTATVTSTVLPTPSPSFWSIDSISFGSGGEGESADLSQIAEDVLPVFSDVYDIGSADKRWYDGYYANKVDINGAEITGSEAGVVVGTLLAGELLVSDNLITPDDSSRRQYFGDKGVVVINGNMDVDGDWMQMPVVPVAEERIDAGQIDTGFVIGTGFNDAPTAIAVQSDGKIVMAGDFTSYDGTSQNRVTRLNSDGSRDTGFVIGTGFNDSPTAIAVQSDGKIVAGGYFTSYDGTSQNRITRLNSDGSRDNGFVIGTGVNQVVFALAVQSDGKILVGGRFTSYNGTSQNRITRLNSDGSRDTGFVIGTGFDDDVNTIVVQSDGKILVGGRFTSYNGTSQNRITRLNSDGSRDTGFVIGTGFSNVSDYVNSFVVESDGKIFVGGNLVGGTYDDDAINSFVVRLNSDGSLNASIGNITNNQVYQLALQSDGKILAAGFFTQNNSITQNRIARFNSDGSLDTGFVIGTGFSGIVYALAVQSDGKIVVGGNFTSYDGTSQNRITRLDAETVVIVPGKEATTSGSPGMIRYNQDISAFQGYNGTSWELLERVTTPPTDLATTGTVDIDFSGAVLRKQGVLTGDITYTGSNYLPGSTVTIRLVTGETNCNLEFPADWVFVGEKPTTLDANKTAILTVTSFGTTESDCVAAWAAQA